MFGRIIGNVRMGFQNLTSPTSDRVYNTSKAATWYNNSATKVLGPIAATAHYFSSPVTAALTAPFLRPLTDLSADWVVEPLTSKVICLATNPLFGADARFGPPTRDVRELTHINDYEEIFSPDDEGFTYLAEAENGLTNSSFFNMFEVLED